MDDLKPLSEVDQMILKSVKEEKHPMKRAALEAICNALLRSDVVVKVSCKNGYEAFLMKSLIRFYDLRFGFLKDGNGFDLEIKNGSLIEVSPEPKLPFC